MFRGLHAQIRFLAMQFVHHGLLFCFRVGVSVEVVVCVRAVCLCCGRVCVCVYVTLGREQPVVDLLWLPATLWGATAFLWYVVRLAV